MSQHSMLKAEGDAVPATLQQLMHWTNQPVAGKLLLGIVIAGR